MADTDMPMPGTSPAAPWAAMLAGVQQFAEQTTRAIAPASGWPAIPGLTDPATLARAEAFWRDGWALWQGMLDPATLPALPKDKRFAGEAWQQPAFDLLRRGHALVGEHLLARVDSLDVDEAERERLRFAARGWLEAISPSNFALTNPEVIARTVETGGQNLVTGFQNLVADLSKGQMTHVAPGAFELGRNLATAPGQVIHRTPLYELIQYAPTTDAVLEAPLVIFPPWINRFYILDLTPEKSFIRWATDQGITVFMVSWRSADASMAEVVWDDYVRAQIDAVDTARSVLGVPAVHAIGYCVAGTTLAATLALLAARGEAEKVASATFFTAQVDFANAGELLHFVSDDQLATLKTLSADGFLDGRYMAHVFNLLRGRDLIWNYATNHYLLGNDYAEFDLLHWNGDTTNLPAKWHSSYLTDLYRDNLLVKPGALSVDGTPIDLTRVTTPAYVQAGREDHIAPAASVWAITHHLAGPLRFVLAGSGHIAGVVNPPAGGKYQYWTNDARVSSLDDFVAGATETKGSWWPDWLSWLRARGATTVPTTGARVPGEGSLPAIESAPGSYVRAR